MNFVVNVIKQRIKTKKISIRNLARICGLDHSFLAKVINGQRSLPRDEKVLRRLARALGLDPVWFVFASGLIPQEYQKFFNDPAFVAGLFRRPGAPPVDLPVSSSEKESITEELL